MEAQNEILTAVREGFARVDQQFKTLRAEFADQLDGVSDGLHLEMRAQSKKLFESVESVRAVIEKVDIKLGLVGENVSNVMTEIEVESVRNTAYEALAEVRHAEKQLRTDNE